MAGEGGGYSVTPVYHFDPPYRHLEISQAITAESSPLHVTGDGPWTGNSCFGVQVAVYQAMHF